MSEETNLGRLVAEIVLDTGSIEESTRNAIDMIGEIEQSVRSASMDIDLGNSNSNISVNNTQAVQNIQEVINEIERAEIAARSEIPVNTNSERAVQNIRDVVEAVRQIGDTAESQNSEIRINTSDAIRNLEDVADSSDDTADSFEDAEEAASNLEAALSTAGHAAETFEAIFPGIGSVLSDTVSLVGETMEMIESGASKGLIAANAVVGGISIAVDWIVSAIDEYNQSQEEALQAQEEARQAAIQAAQEYKNNAAEINNLANEYGNLKLKLDAANMSRADEMDVKNELANIQQQLIDQYGEEAKSIDLVTGNIDKQREAIEKLSEEEDKKYVAKYYSAYRDAQENLAKTQTIEIGTVYTLPNSSKTYNSEQEALLKMLESEGGYKSRARFGDNNNFVQTFSIDIASGDAEEKLYKLSSKLKKLHNSEEISFETYDKNSLIISQAFESIRDSEEQIAGYKNIVEQFEAAQRRLDGKQTVVEQADEINGIMADSITFIQEYSTNLSELANAYQTVAEGGKPDADTLNSLIEKYPAVAQYISETGDLTLRNGEIISASMRMQNIQITQQLEKEKEQLELKKETLGYTGTAENLAQHEEIADRIGEINAQLKVCNSNLSDMDKSKLDDAYQKHLENLDALSAAMEEQKTNSSELQGSMSELADMERQLNDGQQLDFETILSLIDKYPEFAAELTAAADNTDLQRQAIEHLFEAKKQDYILSQKAALEKIKASNEETRIIVENMQKQIMAYAAAGDAMSMVTGITQLGGLVSSLAQSEKEAAALEAKMNAVANIDINSYKSDSSGSSAAEEAKSAYELEIERIENLKSLGKLSTQQELYQLEQIRRKYKLNSEEAMDLEVKLYNLKKELKQDEIDELGTLADAVTEALKNKYAEQQKLEEEHIDESIENWQKWEKETTASIQSEIDALDKLSETQESENARREYEQKRQTTELQLAYEKDDYNRKQLEKELNRLDKEEAQRLLEEEIKARKEELQKQMDEVKETSSAAQEKLQAEKEAISKNYEELTKEFNLQAEAEKVIMQSSQKEMVDLIKSYAPKYNMAGQTLGEQLYEGMKAKVDDIFAYIAEIENYVNSYQQQMAYTANAAADDYWQSRTAYEKEIASMSVQQSAAAKNVTVQQTVNFNQPVESPVETRRQLDRTSQALAQQISNGT